MINNENNNFGGSGFGPENENNANPQQNNPTEPVNEAPQQEPKQETQQEHTQANYREPYYTRRPEHGYGQNPNQNAYGGSYSSPNYSAPHQGQRSTYGSSSANDGGWVFSEKQQKGPSYEGYAKQNESYRWSYDDYQQPAKEKKSKKNSRGLKIFAGILGGIVMVGVLTLAGFGVASLMQDNTSNEVVPSEESTAPSSTVQAALPEHNLTLTDKPEEEKEILSNGKLTIPQRAEKVKASVVGIVNYQQSSGSMYTTGAGEGSGIIMSEDGYIITNAHVIEDAVGLKVVLDDGSEYSAQIVGSDSKTDLAVIKIEATGLSPAEFGNSDQLEVGEQLIAVGNPTGLQLGGTLTVGYVSALNRQIDTTSEMNYIQTDAAINPGNSGGALANEYGQVIGINSSKISGTDIEGLGFAIAINDAQPIIDDLMNYGYVKGRVRMGISVYEMDSFTAQLNNVPQGLVVAGIEANTPAANSGLVPGDIITAIDGKEIYQYNNISEMLKGKKPGETIVLSVFRRTTGYADKELTIEVGLIESVETQAQVQDNYNNAPSSNGNSGNYNGNNGGSYNPFDPFSFFGIQ